MPKITRPAKPIPLIYSVIDGDAIHARLPEIVAACKVVEDLVDREFDHELVPLRYQRARYNINITEPGLLFLFHGMTTLHSVRQVTGHKEQIVMTFGYDYPNAEIWVRNQLNDYLFTPDNVGESDPNYLS